MAELIIFEDNRATRELLSLYLANNGHDVRALTGTEDLQTIVTNKPADLILLDLDLGATSGAELCQELRSMPPPHNATPILILSCAAQHEVDKLSLDIDGYILKMNSLSEILSQINRYLDKPNLPAIKPSSMPFIGNGHSNGHGFNNAALTQAARDAAASNGSSGMHTGDDEDLTYSQHGHEASFAIRQQNPNAFSILEEDVLETLYQDLDHEVFLEIMDVFVADLKKRITDINLALINKNTQQIFAQAHALKSSAATYGASQLAVMCTNINLAYHEDNHATVHQQASLLTQTTLLTIKAVNQYTNAKRSCQQQPSQ